MDLRLKLDDTDFEKLADSARSLIPALAPEWTDHNIHDPGIMLLELMAWVAEAQIYSLSRMRVDERLAYARLLGIDLGGPRPASGLIWPLEPDEAGHLAGTVGGQSLPRFAHVEANHPDLPLFRLSVDQHLTPAILTRVITRFADGRTADNTRINRQSGTTYLPFGASPSVGDRLELSFDGHAIAPGGSGAFVLGVEIDRFAADTTATVSGPSGLLASMRDSSGERPVAVSRDTTDGLNRSGVLLLDIAENEQRRIPPSGEPKFDLILRPRAAGFLRPPRVRRIVPNVLAVEQIEQVVEEVPDFGQGLPGQSYTLRRVGRLAERALAVEVDGESWTPVGDLGRSDPDDKHYEIDRTGEQLFFGNGLNGRLPAAGAWLRVAYDVCGGARGNAPAGIGWLVRGVPGIFGRNSQPCSGASNAMQMNDLQAQARRNLATRVTHVTPGDLEDAALALIDLRVARAHELAPLPCQPRGTRTLLAVAKAEPDLDAALSPENALWLERVRARLAPGLPAGQRLEVVAPRYVRVRIAAKLTIPASGDATKVKEKVNEFLKLKFGDAVSGDSIWTFGRDLTLLTVKGWLRKANGVLGVETTTLYRNGVAQRGGIAIGVTELPRFEEIDGDIVIERLAVGAMS